MQNNFITFHVFYYRSTTRCSNRCTVARKCPCKHDQTLCSLLCHPGHLCANLCKDSIADEVIDVDMLKSKLRKPKQKWMQVERVVLHETHKQMLTSNHEWFDDCTISAAQSLLKQKYPDIRGYNLLPWLKHCLLNKL